MRLLLLLFMAFFSVPALAAPRVLATIAPLAGIAAAVMDGVATPDLLIKNNASPHTYQLKPSDMAALADADIVVWDGAGLENFLAGKLPTLAPRARLLGLMDEDAGMHHLPVRSGDNWEPDGDEDGHGADDPHAWLAPDNASAFAGRLAKALAESDPENAGKYTANAARFEVELKRLDAELKQLLAPVANRGFIVFHDGYQYFSHHYGLKELGAITLAPDVAPSARRLAMLQQRIQQQGAVCVFAEPQFSAALVTTLASGTTVRTGVLNPDASDLPVNAQLYGAYLRRLASSFRDCLTPG